MARMKFLCDAERCIECNAALQHVKMNMKYLGVSTEEELLQYKTVSQEKDLYQWLVCTAQTHHVWRYAL